MNEALLSLCLNLMILLSCAAWLIFFYFPRFGRPIKWNVETINIDAVLKRRSAMDLIKKGGAVNLIARPIQPKTLASRSRVSLIIDNLDSIDAILIVTLNSRPRVHKQLTGVLPENLIACGGKVEMASVAEGEDGARRFVVDLSGEESGWQVVVENAFVGYRTGFHVYEMMGCVCLTKGLWRMLVAPENGHLLSGGENENISLRFDQTNDDATPTFDASFAFYKPEAAKEIWAIVFSAITGVSLQSSVDAVTKLLLALK